MKTFLIKIGLLCFILVIADYSLGGIIGRISKSIAVGGQGRDNYIADKCKEDILVFGSSRAVHHYNSVILEDSLGASSYNCGDDGSGVILSYGRLLMLEERHSPKIVIFDVNPSFDLDLNDNHKYLGWLKTHYEKDCIKPIFYDVDKTEKYKMMSKLYRYNSRFLQNVFVYLTGLANDGGTKGYRPLEGELDVMKIKENDTDAFGDHKIDSLKLRYIEKFIDLCKGSNLYFVVSPIWYGMNNSEIQPIKEICSKRNVPFFDYSNNPKYVHRNEFFKDGIHMNSKGADEFTRDLVFTIKTFNSANE